MAETLAEIDLSDHNKLSMFEVRALELPLRFLSNDDLEVKKVAVKAPRSHSNVAIATTAQEADCEEFSLLESKEDTFKLSRGQCSELITV
ncbi:hypothetical protein OIU76_022810 [Salix suchowensis]|nr:hypothetical protein OIU76_022810 [Salix suchowensis]